MPYKSLTQNQRKAIKSLMDPKNKSYRQGCYKGSGRRLWTFTDNYNSVSGRSKLHASDQEYYRRARNRVLFP